MTPPPHAPRLNLAQTIESVYFPLQLVYFFHFVSSFPTKHRLPKMASIKMKVFPASNASAAEVQNWLTSHFTERDLDSSNVPSDSNLLAHPQTMHMDWNCYS
jgi:hypothetical protein